MKAINPESAAQVLIFRTAMYVLFNELPPERRGAAIAELEALLNMQVSVMLGGPMPDSVADEVTSQVNALLDALKFVRPAV